MRIGVSGHQSRAGIDWKWVGNYLNNWLKSRPRSTEAYSCLAAGADQVFSQAVMENGLPLTAVIPFDGYEAVFSDQRALAIYRTLLPNCRVENLHLNHLNSQVAFMKASEYIVDAVDLMVFVWDRRPSASFGGTADVVAYAVNREKRCAYLDPITQTHEGDWS